MKTKPKHPNTHKEIVVIHPNKMVIQEKVSEKLGPNEVRISVKAIGVNYADIAVKMGVYAAAKKYPITPGYEFSGEVIEIGTKVKNAKVSDAIFGLTRFGAYSTEIIVNENHVWPKPKNWSFEEAAGFQVTFLTAYYGLVDRAHLKSKEKVLIHSAAGGVGTVAIQIAKIMGATVVGVVGKSHKISTVKKLGADEIIDKSTEDLWSKAEEYSHDGYDVILDPNGPSTLKQSYQHLTKGGRLLIYGFHSMLPQHNQKINCWKWLQIIYQYLYMTRINPVFNPFSAVSENKGIIGFNLIFLFERKELLKQAIDDFTTWLKSGKIKPPVIYKTYSFEQVAEAHKDIQSGETVGKLILVVERK